MYQWNHRFWLKSWLGANQEIGRPKSRVSHSSARGLRTKRGCSPTSIEISKALQQGQEDPVRDVVDGDGLLLGLPILTPTSRVLPILGFVHQKKWCLPPLNVDFTWFNHEILDFYRWYGDTVIPSGTPPKLKSGESRRTISKGKNDPNSQVRFSHCLMLGFNPLMIWPTTMRLSHGRRSPARRGHPRL